MANTVRLTVEQSANNSADICAMELLQYEDGSPKGGREVVVDREEAAEFMSDCTGWDWVLHQFQDTDGQTIQLTAVDRYYEGYGVVLTMDTEDWATWIDAYEVPEDSEVPLNLLVNA